MTNLTLQAAIQPFARLYRYTERARRRIIRVLARLYRRCLSRVTYIGTTGSWGKSTTTALICKVLEPHGRVATGNPDHHCIPIVIARHILRMHPLARYCVLELGGGRPGQLARSGGIMRPDIGVVTHVAYDHYRAYKSIDRIAENKADLVRCLPESGFAVLNADDERVAAMAHLTRAQVVTVGVSQEATWRAENLSSAWPDGLSFDLVHDGVRHHVSTRLNGEHWVYPVLFAIAVGHISGVSIDDAVRSVGVAENIRGRMDICAFDDGVTYTDDSWKNPYHAVPASLAWLEQAQAQRKIVVLGTLSDYPGGGSRKYREIARKALDIADTVLFVGKHANSARKAAPEHAPERLRMFGTVYEARHCLRELLQPGDLVLIKGSGGADHLERLRMDREEGVHCWRQGCGVPQACMDCPRRNDAILPDLDSPATTPQPAGAASMGP